MILNFKRGNSVVDSILFVVIIVVFAIIIVIGYKVLSDLNAEIQADEDMDVNAKAVSSTITTKYPKVFDAGFVLAFVLLWIVVIVASFNLPTHPIYFGVSLFLMVFVVFIGGALANFYDDITTDDDLSSAATEFPMINWIMEHLLHLTIVITASIMLTLYGKNRMEEGY